MNSGFWKDKRVFLTGHTGFKGGWLAIVLHRLGAQVTGYALPPISDQTIFAASAISRKIRNVIDDLRDLDALKAAVREAKPEIVFHLAAQSLVRRSYGNPVETYATNVMGTVNLLEAARACDGLRAVIVATSDKCYENRETGQAYHETDRLGGKDPYSSSKAAAEIVTAAYRSSFFPLSPAVATVRAGNVIGGGDWCEDRLVPDLMRGVINKAPTLIRNPAAVRPWQHVLEPISGYLTVAERLWAKDSEPPTTLNFGPDKESERTVGSLADLFCRLWGKGAAWKHIDDSRLAEAQLLRLDSSMARKVLGWNPRWNFEQAVEATVEWYRALVERQDVDQTTERQIEAYFSAS